MSELSKDSTAFPSDWVHCKVSDLIEHGVIEKPLDGNHGEIHPSGADFVDDGIPFVMATDINAGKIDFVSCKFITEEQSQKLRKGFAKEGDVLLTHKASLGRTAIVKRTKYPYLVLTPQVTYYRVIDSDKLSNRFLRYFFDSPYFQETLKNHGDAGSTRAYVGITAQRDLPIAFPRSFNEQNSLATVLASFDDKIDLLHRQNRTLEAMARVLFREWFVEGASDEWQEKRVDGVADLNRSTVTNIYQHSTIQYLDTGSLTEGAFGETPLLSLREAPSRAKRLVQHNDVLLSTVRPDQKHYGIVKRPADNLVVSTGFCVISAKAVDPHFLYLFLTSDEMTDYLHSIAEGSTSTYPSLKPSDLGALTFRYPPLDLHDTFAKFATACWDKIYLNSRQIESLEKLRNGLLPKLMSGELRVQYD